jgi:hypothetical protein
MKIKLLTQSGDFVRDAEILPFNEYPAVMIWGDRVFQHSNIQGEYRECFSYIVIDRQQWLTE